MTKVQIPRNTSYIANGAFYSCTNLSEISMANPQPPAVDYYTFDLVNKTTCKLIVPTGSATTYTAANYWKEFTQVSEQQFSNILFNRNVNPLTYSKSENKITIIGLELGELYRIYNLSGQVVNDGICNDKYLDIVLKNKGIYLLKTDTKRLKMSI